MDKEAHLQWEKLESHQGEQYQVGHNEFELAAKAKVESGTDSKGILGFFENKKTFEVNVNWPVGKDDKLIPTTHDILNKTGITAYSLTAGEGHFTYTLRFTSSVNYNYYFYDESKDSYQVNCFLTGNHSVQYNSPKPTIVHITGS